MYISGGEIICALKVVRKVKEELEKNGFISTAEEIVKYLESVSETKDQVDLDLQEQKEHEQI